MATNFFQKRKLKLYFSRLQNHGVQSFTVFRILKLYKCDWKWYIKWECCISIKKQRKWVFFNIYLCFITSKSFDTRCSVFIKNCSWKHKNELKQQLWKITKINNISIYPCFVITLLLFLNSIINSIISFVSNHSSNTYLF